VSVLIGAWVVVEAHRGIIIRHAQSRYAAKQSAQDETCEKRSRPHAWDRREVENASKDDVRVEVIFSGSDERGNAWPVAVWVAFAGRGAE
jgi:hypothetical protein